MLLDLDALPSVAVTVALVSVETPPTLAPKVLVVAPAGTTMLAGTVSSAEVELIAIVVLDADAFARVAVHDIVLLDMAPVGEHAKETSAGTIRFTEVARESLNVAVIVAV